MNVEEADRLRGDTSNFIHIVMRCQKDVQTKILNRQLDSQRYDRFRLDILI